jgi:hypothetical protein
MSRKGKETTPPEVVPFRESVVQNCAMMGERTFRGYRGNPDKVRCR